MKSHQIIIVGLSASCLVAWSATPAFGQVREPPPAETRAMEPETAPRAVSGANPYSRGLIGERYFGVDGGWERFENDVSDDGWGAGVELNMPFPVDTQTQFGTDLRLRGDYRDVFDRDIYDVEGVLRGYVPNTEGFTPFLGVGFGWVDFDETSSTYVPVEAGIEFAMGAMALVPHFRYSFAFDSAVDDFWEVGATGVYWLDAGWGLTASFTYTDYDDIGEFDTIDSGFGARLGLVFAY